MHKVTLEILVKTCYNGSSKKWKRKKFRKIITKIEKR